MKKILFVATVDIHIINFHLHIIQSLKQLGNKVDVAANGSFCNGDIHRKYDVCFSKNPLSFDNIKAFFKIKKIIKENHYDIISCHTPLSSFFTRLAVGDDSQTKVMYTAHGFHFFKGASWINQLVYKNMEKIAARYTDVLVTINQEDYQSSLNFRLKKDGKCVYIPGIGVDIERIANITFDEDKLKQELNIEEDDFLILSVGELNNNKNHLFVMETLLAEFKSNQKLKYYICGVGPNHACYEKFIQDNNLQEQIKLLGYREDIYQIYHLANLFIFPSKREGLPVSLIEAMAAGLIPIVTNVRGNRDVVENGKTGFIIEVGDSQALLNDYKKIKNQFINLQQMKTDSYDSLSLYHIKKIESKILSLYQ
ncbi:MAG: glycosyltransferase family 4 protein [Erysipelotrichaceae bacterium]